MQVINVVTMTLSVTSLIGCAGLEVEPVLNAAADKAARGFRYYRSAPFLLVYTDNKGGLQTKLLYLPDPTRKMSVRPYNCLASNKATLVFDKGRLTQAKTEIDETAIPSAVITSLEKVAKELVKARLAPPRKPLTCRPRICSG